jgi:F-type H+-transporting ATPase subunit b
MNATPRILAPIAAAVLMLAIPAARAQEHAATAAGEHAEGHDKVGAIPSVQQGTVVGLASIVVFGVVFAVLAAKVWPKISHALADRENKIRSEIEAAETAQQQARRALEEYERNLADARAQAQKLLDDALAQQQALSADLKAKAEIELTAMRDRARRDIESAKKAALAEIYTEASDVATQIAAKILKKEINARDQQRLVEESLSELQALGSRA